MKRTFFAALILVVVTFLTGCMTTETTYSPRYNNTSYVSSTGYGVGDYGLGFGTYNGANYGPGYGTLMAW